MLLPFSFHSLLPRWRPSQLVVCWRRDPCDRRDVEGNMVLVDLYNSVCNFGAFSFSLLCLPRCRGA